MRGCFTLAVQASRVHYPNMDPTYKLSSGSSLNLPQIPMQLFFQQTFCADITGWQQAQPPQDPLLSKPAKMNYSTWASAAPMPISNAFPFEKQGNCYFQLSLLSEESQSIVASNVLSSMVPLTGVSFLTSRSSTLTNLYWTAKNKNMQYAK